MLFFKQNNKAPWPSGKAQVCKTSIPRSESEWRLQNKKHCTCSAFCFGDATASERHVSGRFEFGNNGKTIEYRFFLSFSLQSKERYELSVSKRRKATMRRERSGRLKHFTNARFYAILKSERRWRYEENNKRDVYGLYKGSL